MALTYRPFSDAEQLEELDHDLHMNIPDGERIVFGMAGAALILFAGSCRGVAQWLLLGVGAALVRRGWLGYSKCYAHLAVDPRHGTHGEPAPT